MGKRRIFLAVDLSDAARAVCAAHIESLRARFPKVRVGWERPEKVHVTLKFLGDTAEDVMQDLEAGVRKVAGRHTVVPMRLTGPGVFPSPSKPRILWIGLKDVLSPIHRELEDICADLGFEREKKVFRPHVTIGRIRQPFDARELAGVHIASQIEPVEFEVVGLVIYESKLQPSGSIYSKVALLPFHVRTPRR